MTDQPIVLRVGRPDDATEVASVYLAVWRVHSNELVSGSSPSSGSQQRAQEQELGIAALEEQRSRFTKFLQTGERLFVVAEFQSGTPGSRLCGFLSYGPSYTLSEHGEVMQLYVHPEFQRRGVGSRLLSAAWFDMAEHHWAAEGMHVWCTLNNPGNRVYTQAGWAPTGKEKTLTPTLSSDSVHVAEYAAPSARPAGKTELRRPQQPSGMLRFRFPSDISWLAFIAATFMAVISVLLGGGFFSKSPGRSADSASDPDRYGDNGILVRVNPEMSAASEARCLDGSWPSYYHRSAPSGGSLGERRWLLYFQGGGYCVPGTTLHAPFPPTLVDTCESRSSTMRGSTLSDSEEKDFSQKPLFSRDPVLNPTFHNWHVVFLRYCDGASFADSHGFGNFQAILHSLLDAGMRNASDITVSGCSAGAVAAGLHVDAVQRAVPLAFVVALLDSGVFPDWSRSASPALPDENPEVPPGVWPLDAELRRLFRERGLATSGAIPASCLAHYADAPWRCLFLEYLIPFVQAPTFILQSRFDASNVRSVQSQQGLGALGSGIAARLAAALEQSPSSHGLFLDSCFHHCMSWGQIQSESGATQPEAFLAWWSSLPRDRAGLVRSSLHQRHWEHHPRNISNIGPCWEDSCCSQARADLDTWQDSFSEDAARSASLS